MNIDRELVAEIETNRRARHTEQHPDGCPDWCADCMERLTCRNGRHEWPTAYSDGDTCYCGRFYLQANAINERPHIIDSEAQR